jgi:hypothetical protein
MPCCSSRLPTEQQRCSYSSCLQTSDTSNGHNIFSAMADAWPLQELIGHCTAVYHANRTAALQLEQHLSQYGYQRPAAAVLEPENPDDFVSQEDQQQFGALGTPQHLFCNQKVAAVVGCTACNLFDCCAGCILIPYAGTNQAADSHCCNLI